MFAMKSIVLSFLCFLSFSSLKAQYELVWSDEFNNSFLDTSKWNIESNIGIWNTGSNKELQHYRKENIALGTDSNGNKCLIITAKKESHKEYSFTSGKIDTKAKLSVKYGRIEARIKMPDIATGLWPAFWLLGFSPDTWPKCGEIDVVELGYKDGIVNNTQNKLISGALHWENQDNPSNSYASYGRKTTLSVSMNEDFHLYTVEWTPTYIKMFFDNTEYYAMNTNESNAEEFRNNPFFIIFNLAVGGIFPEIYDPAKITAPMPANMYVDYVRVYQKSGEGELNTKPHKMYGNFGVYDETGSNVFKLDPAWDLQIDTKGLTATSITPKEGSVCAAYTTSDGQNFELSFLAPYSRNMSNYSNGSLYFYINTNLQNEFQLSVGNSEVTINNTSNFNFKRDGSWVRVNIPISEFGEGIKFDSIVQFLTIKGVGATDAYLAIDQIYWSQLSASNDNYFGIFTDNPNITNKILIDNQNIHLYVWEGTLSSFKDDNIYEGENDWAFKGVSGKTWFGFGITSDNPFDMTAYKNGALHFTLRTAAQNEFWIGIDGANNTKPRITFPANNGLYGFKRDGQWHNIVIPMADFIAKGLDPGGCGNIFMLGGAGAPAAICIDDVYFSTDGKSIDNPVINPATSVSQINNLKVNIYPNPVKGSFMIKGVEKKSELEIVDMSGRLMLKSNYLSSEHIDVHQFEKGIYFIRLKTGNQYHNLRIVKE